MLLSKGTEVLLVALGRVGGQGPLAQGHGAAAGHVSLGAGTERGEALGMLLCPGIGVTKPRVFGEEMFCFACSLSAAEKGQWGCHIPGAVGWINVSSQPQLTLAFRRN